MGILDFNKPKWLHKDVEARREAIAQLDPNETEILVMLALEDEDRNVRKAAISRIEAIEVLEKIEKESSTKELAQISERKEHLLLERILSSKDNTQGRQDISRINSPKLLADIAINAELAENRIDAINRIDDQLLLCQIIEQKCGKEPAKAALNKIDNSELLEILSEKAASKTARRFALDKLTEKELLNRKPDPAELKDKTLAALADEANTLLSTGNWDDAAERLISIKQEWQQLDSEGVHQDHQKFTEKCLSFEDRYRQIKEHREAEKAKATKYEKQRDRLESICATIEGLTGSTADNALTLQQEAVNEWNSLLEDPEERAIPGAIIMKRFEQSCRSFHKTNENIAREKQIVSSLENQCLQATNLISSGNLKKAGIILAKTKKELSTKNLKYFSPSPLNKLLAETGKSIKQSEKEAHRHNLDQRTELCNKLENISVSKNPGKAESQVQNLSDQWQKLSHLDDPKVAVLEERFNKALENFMEKQKAFYHDQDWQLWANLSLKEKLVERVKALDLEENLEKVINTVKKSQMDWKDIGPVPHKVSQKIWERFHSACDRNFKRGAPYLEELKIKRTEAMTRRKEIVGEAEQIAESTDWIRSAKALKKLQEEWKTLLHGSRREEEKLYKHFRSVCNKFFERRHENFKLNEEERGRNLAEKEKLCEEAEHLAESPLPDNSKQFIALQARWKKIGHVPKDMEQKVWKRFRTACDQFFNWLDEQRENNLKQKENLCDELEKIMAEASEEIRQQKIVEKITELQQKWKEIGPVPLKLKDTIRERFNSACNELSRARNKQLEKEKNERRQNQEQKEEILREAENLAGSGTDKKITAQLQVLQNKWQQIGLAPKEVNNELNTQFKMLCDAFVEGRHQYFTELGKQRLANQKKKESLCLRLENILGTASDSVARGEDKALSLAEELKQAMQDNFMLAGRRKEKKAVKDEVKMIQQEWKKTGSALREFEKKLNDRYKQAIASFHNQLKEDTQEKK